MKEFVSEKLDDLEDVDLRNAHPEYRNLVNEYREGILLFTIMEKEVWNKAAADTAGLDAFYKANSQKYAAGDSGYAPGSSLRMTPCSWRGL